MLSAVFRHRFKAASVAMTHCSLVGALIAMMPIGGYVSVARAEQPTVSFSQSNADSLQRHVIVGYQGWFSCPGDVGVPPYVHWLNTRGPNVDFLPDLNELPQKDRCTMNSNAVRSPKPAIYSSANPDVVDLHFRWMQEYAISTAAVQRFVSVLRSPTNKAFADAVLKQVRLAANKYHRTFFVEYDLSGSSPKDIDLIVSDWKDLEASGMVTDPSYQRVRNAPLVGFWGLGFAGRPWTPAGADELLSRTAAIDHPAVMVGVPTYWRTGTRDASPDSAWLDVWKKTAVLSPWAVGRYGTQQEFLQLFTTVELSDLTWAHQEGLLYIPTVFPGFSWSNMHANTAMRNQIPRACGSFFERQLETIRLSRADAIFVAMFDELDEGTAVYKLLPHRPEGDFLSLDTDGCNLPSDFYLQLIKRASTNFATAH